MGGRARPGGRAVHPPRGPPPPDPPLRPGGPPPRPGDPPGLGARVRAFPRPPRAAPPIRDLPSVEFVAGDVCAPAAVRRALAGSEVVFHAAGVVAVWGPGLTVMDAVHRRGTANVLAAAPSA